MVADEREDGPDRHRRGRIWFLAACVAVVLAIAVGFFLHLPTARTTPIAGTVRCTSGAAVRGVWVQEAQGTGGFASWSAQVDDSSVAHFSFDVRGSRYAVHVGCGGSPERWLLELRSGYVAAEHPEFVCFDRPGDAQYRTCTTAG